MTLNRWLAPQDSVLAKVALDHTLIAEEMAEYTCVWFHNQLAQFIKSDDRTLLINGGPASGKTTLASSLAERLQRPVARHSYTTVFFSAGAAPSQVSSVGVVQVLLHQLLNARVGNMNLYHAVARAYEAARHTADAGKYEDLIWRAFEEVVKTPLEGSNDTVVIVDGLDQLPGGSSAGASLLQRLVGAVENGKGTKLIALGQDLKLPAGSSGNVRTMLPADTSADIHEIALKKLASGHHFRSKSGREQESIISRIVSIANGSFTWAILTCEVLLLEKSADDFTKAVSNFQNPKLSIEDLLHILVTRLQPSDEAKLLLSWLSYTARPLAYREIECLYATNASARSKADQPTDVHRIIHSVAPLLSARDHTVSLRHGVAQNALRDLFKSSKISTPVKDQHTDLFLRILTYAKSSLPEGGEPTLDDTDRSVVEASFSRHPLLEYAVRYWVWHFTQTTGFKTGKAPDAKSVPDMDKTFPSSTIMAILEWICWDDQFPGAKEVEIHQTAGQVRKQILSEQHPAVLQSYISTACYYEMMEDWTHASPIWFTISTVGRDVLSVSHPIVVESAVRFLTSTDSRITSSRTEIATQRETILVLLISAYERQFGMQSEIVIETRQRLVELYRQINEASRADEVLKIIHGDTSSHRRQDSGTTREVNGRLQVSLGKAKGSTALNGYDGEIFMDDDEEDEDTALTETGQVDVILRQIEQHVAKKEHVQAEQLHIDLLQRISQACRSTSNMDWHSKKIDVFQSYSSFLEKQERHAEAVSLTTSLWRDYQHSELSFSETIISKLKHSARFLKSVGEYSAALSIYKHASSYYRNVRKDESHSVTEIEEEIAAVSSQALRQTSRSASSKSEATSESSRYEMFQFLVSDKSKSIDSTTMSLAKSLSMKYVEQGSWSQAVPIIEATLSRTWSSFLSKSVHDMTLATSFQSESIELAERLAYVYKQQRRFEKVEDIYVRLFRAALSSPKDQPLLDKATRLLLDFYVTRGHPDKAIFIYQELLAVYRRVYGPDHEKTISVLYELGARCRSHARSHPYWIEYYQQIVAVLNKSASTVHTRAMEAAVVVAQCYWEERRASDAVGLYAVIWNTFVSNHKDFKLFKDETFVRNLYERYYQSLEETTADFATLRKVTAEYRETTRAAFGAESTLAVESTLALARVSQQSESHMEESIALFEEASSKSSRSTSSSSSTVAEQSELRQTLATMYKRRIFHFSSSSASSETISKATSVYQEQLKEMKSKHTYSSEETLNSLRELSMLYVRQGKTESASQELSKALVEIVRHETSSQKMYEAAESLVQSYRACNMTQRCASLVEEMHYQLIVKEKRSSSSFSVVESSKTSLAFVAAMEYQLRKDLSVTLTEITASLTAEFFMYSNFKHLVTSNASLDKVLIAAAPLRHLCQYWKHTAIAEAVEHECVQLFVRRDASSVQLLSKDSPRIFIVGILDYLGGRKSNDFVCSVILAGNRTTKMLVDNNKFTDAHDVVKITFMYAQYRNGYRTGGAKGISRGFELASYLDGRGENKCSDPQLRKKLLQLSNDIVKDILKICKEQNINIAQVSLKELNELIALLGEQQDYDTLEVGSCPLIASQTPLTHLSDTAQPTLVDARSAENLAAGGPHDHRPPPHQRALPCRTPDQGPAPVRGHCLQLPPRARRYASGHAGDVRTPRPALHQHRTVVPAGGERRQG